MVHWGSNEYRVFGPLVGGSLGNFDSWCLCILMRPYYVSQPGLQRARQLLDQEKDILNAWGFYVLSRLDGYNLTWKKKICELLWKKKMLYQYFYLDKLSTHRSPSSLGNSSSLPLLFWCNDQYVCHLQLCGRVEAQKNSRPFLFIMQKKCGSGQHLTHDYLFLSPLPANK